MEEAEEALKREAIAIDSICGVQVPKRIVASDIGSQNKAVKIATIASRADLKNNISQLVIIEARENRKALEVDSLSYNFAELLEASGRD